MRFCLAVFRSRNETLYLANSLIKLGYRVNVINTPSDAGLSCGICVKFDEYLLGIVKQYVQSKPFRSFSGFYRVTANRGRNTYERIG